MNINPTSLLDTVSDLCLKSIKLDPEHINAYIMIYITRSLSAHWDAEHGGTFNVEKLTDQPIAQNQPISINKHPLFLWNTALILQQAQRIHADQRRHNNVLESRIVSLATQLSGIFAEMHEAHNLSSELHLINTLARIESNIDPSMEINKGTESAKRCISINSKHAECHAILSYLRMLAIATIRFPTNSDIDELKKEVANIQMISSENQRNEKIQQICSEMHLIGISKTRNLPTTFRIELAARGIKCVTSALALAPHWPRAMALHASLMLESYPFGGAQVLNQARTVFSDAFAGNPNLKNRFGETAKEVERRLAELEAGR